MFGRVEHFKIHACHCLGLVGAGCVVTARPSHAAHKAASCAVNRATMLGWSSRLGLAEAGRSEPLAPRPAALPRAVVLGAATAALRCRRVCTADACNILMGQVGPIQ